MRSVRVPQLVPPSPNRGNGREHWAARARRVKKERRDTALALSWHERPALPVVVTLVRCAPRFLDDDNATASMKAVRDEVASWLGVDDRDPRVSFRVEQRREAAKSRGTLIEFEEPNQ